MRNILEIIKSQKLVGYLSKSSLKTGEQELLHGGRETQDVHHRSTHTNGDLHLLRS